MPTILSRCQRYDFRNIPTREIAGHLKAICKQEKIKADEDALMLVAKAGAGSMRNALSLLDRMLSVGQKSLTVEMIEQMLGMPRSQVIFDLAQAIGEGSAKPVLEIAAKQIEGGMSPDTLMGGLIDHLRNLLVIRACGAKSDLVEVPGLSLDELQKQSEQFDAVALSQDIAILEELRRSMRTSQAGRALLDATLVRLALAEQFASVDELIARVDGKASAPARFPALKKNDELKNSRSITGFQPVVPEHGLETRETNIEPVALNDLPTVWQTMLKVLSSKSASFPPLVEDASLVSIDDGMAVVRYPHDREPLARMLDRNGKREIIRDALCGVLNAAVGLKIEIAPAPESAESMPASIPSTAESNVRITADLRRRVAK